MAQFVLNRNYTLISKTGFSIRFDKGIPANVPVSVIAEAVAIGAERIDAQQGALVDDDKVVLPDEPAGEERETLVFNLFDMLIGKNRREDFTAQGIPHVKAIKEALGFTIDNKERDKLWARYHIVKGEQA